jgi:hypothetical protein
MYSATDTPVLARVGCPIRRSPGQSLFAAHRRLSQLTTSFIDSWCQGIHRTPLVALPLHPEFCARCQAQTGISHCVTCCNRNYLLQDIQLSKIRLRPFGLRRDRAAITSRPPSILACLAEASRAHGPGEANAGGEYRARTGDLLVANQALSQLS